MLVVRNEENKPTRRTSRTGQRALQQWVQYLFIFLSSTTVWPVECPAFSYTRESRSEKIVGAAWAPPTSSRVRRMFIHSRQIVASEWGHIFGAAVTHPSTWTLVRTATVGPGIEVSSGHSSAVSGHFHTRRVSWSQGLGRLIAHVVPEAIVRQGYAGQELRTGSEGGEMVHCARTTAKRSARPRSNFPALVPNDGDFFNFSFARKRKKKIPLVMPR